MKQVHNISYEDILSVWQKYLWPNRQEIKPINLWKKNPKGYPYNHGLHKPWRFNPLVIDKSIEKYSPFFFGIYEEDQLVAVNSGYQTDDITFRSRGLYVLKEFRNKGYAKLLLHKTIDTAYIGGCDVCWSIPRKESLGCYESCGFSQKGGWFETDYGLNCYAELDLNEI